MAKKAKKSDAQFAIDRYDLPDVPDYVVAELKYESPVTFSPSTFSAPAAGERSASGLNSILSKFAIHKVRSHFDLSAATITARAAAASGLPEAPTSKVLAKKGLGT